MFILSNSAISSRQFGGKFIKLFSYISSHKVLHRIDNNLQLFLTAGDQILVDTLLQDGSEVLQTGGGKSVLIGDNSHNNINFVLLIPRNSEGRYNNRVSWQNFIVVYYIESKN